MPPAAAPTREGGLAAWFDLRARASDVATEVRAGLATFMVMAYIIFVNPFTWSITNGIGAGFVTYTAIKVLNGKAARLPFLVYAASAAFVVYFALPLVERAVK